MLSPSPFSIYASTFLNRDQSSSTSSQPLFYSATAGEGSDDESPFRRGDDTPGARSLVDDEDGTPRLAGDVGDDSVAHVLFDAQTVEEDSGYPADQEAHQQALSQQHGDEDEFPVDLDALPMMDSEMFDSARSLRVAGAPQQPQPGWRTHDSQYRAASSSQSQSPHSPPIIDPYGYSSEEDEDEAEIPTAPPAFLATESVALTPPPVPPTRTAISVQLNESLLPRDGVSRSLFYLPDPDRPVGRNKYHDSEWMTAWLSAVSLCALGSVLILFVTNSSPKTKNPDPTTPTPYSTLTHTIPLLTVLTLSSAAVSYSYLILFRFAVRPMLILTALSTPVFLFLASAYAFSSSFLSETGVTPTWGETVGLRLFSVVPLGFAYLSAKSFYTRYESLLQTAAVVELSTSLLITHPSVLLLSLAVLIASFIASLPFLSLVLRLLLVGYFSRPANDAHVWVWHVRNWAGTLALGVLTIWLWSWAIARGVMRVVVGGVVGHWYFTAHDPAYTVLSQQQATRAALSRATGPSLGSICAGSLTIGSVQTALIGLQWLRHLTTPPQLRFLAPLHPLAFLARIISAFDSLSTYALVYIGITGEGFWTSARRARGFIANNGAGTPGANSEDDEDEDIGASRRRRNRRRGHVQARRMSDYILVSRLLSLSALSLAVFSAVGGYVFAAHSLSGPTNAPLAAFTCGIVTFLVVKFGLDLGEDAADAMFVCYQIDVQAGTKHRVEVFEVFEGRPERGPVAV